MTSSLDGTFTGFNGTFVDQNDLGNSETSLIDSVTTSFLNHIVQIASGETESDFLTEETALAQAEDTPDTVWNGTTGDSRR